MASIAEIRQQYPQYKDMTDQQVADGLYKKFYSDMPRDQFDKKVGFTPRSNGEYAAGLFDQFVQGMPVVGPALQNAAAAVTAATEPLYSNTGDTSFGDRYASNRDFLRGRTQEFSKDNPAASTAANIGGSVTALTLLLRGNPAAASALGLTGPLGQQILRSALSGGVISGADAATRGEDLKGIAESAAIGVGLGAVTPPVIAGAAKGLNVASNAVTNAVRPFVKPADDVAVSKVQTALTRDGLDQTALTNRLAELGPDAMLADVSANLRQQASTIASTPGNGQQVVRDALRARTQAAGDRVQAAATEALGPSKNITEIADEIVARRRAEAGPLYEAAYAKPFNSTPTLENILKTPAGKDAEKYARALAENEGVPFARDVRGFDLIKRSLDDMHDLATRSGRNNEARILDGMRKRVVEEVDRAVPEYKAARQAFENETKIKIALEDGTKFLENKLHPAQLKKQLDAMSDAERESFLTGARGAIDNIMGTARNDALAARRMFEKGFNREKLDMLVGKVEADRLINRLASETTFATTDARVTNNTETAARIFGRADVEGVTPDLSMRGAFQAGGTGGMLRTAAVNVVDKAIEAVRGRRNDAIQQSMALLLTARGVDRNAAIQKLFKEAQQMDRTGQYAQQLARILAGVRAAQPSLTND